ncbi:hypothetical protein [Bosea thiooxidans]
MPALLALALAFFAAVATAQAQSPAKPQGGRDWPTEKCERYKAAFTQAVARQGKQGLGPEFLASHDAFLASNCQARADVCARSKEELALANTLVVMAMNQGMASTFLPFYCRG